MLKNITFTQKKFVLNFIWDTRSLKFSKNSKLYKLIDVFTQVISSNYQVFPEVAGNLKYRSVNSLELSVQLCGDYKIKRLNKEYRAKDKITDVLSFPLNEDLRCPENFPPYRCEELALGDIFICKGRTLAQAKEFKLTFEEEFVHLLAHGLLHLLGYDHELSEGEEKLMERYEQEIMKKVSKKKISN
jgi:probable rRNA maturation factor